jgi:drug/metabolite transporter (DMT)-like permease
MRYLPAVIVDVVLVLIFAAIGRASHDENPAGFLLTAWPFLVALLVGHLVAALLPGRPRRPWSVLWGAVVWIVTVAGGMLVRVLSGDTAEVPFIIVATLVLGVFLVGWRAVAALLRRRRSSTTADAADEGSEDLDGSPA